MKLQNGWYRRHSKKVTWVTAVWHEDHRHCMILKLRTEDKYYIYPYDTEKATGLDYGQRDGPYKTLKAAKVRLLMGNFDYKPAEVPNGLGTR